MNSKYILKLVVLVLIAIGFNACGGGGGGGDDAYFKNSEELIQIDEYCITNPTSTDISNYITIYSGDVIVKDTDVAEISVYHDYTGVKKVCLVTPSAHIIRK